MNWLLNYLCSQSKPYLAVVLVFGLILITFSCGTKPRASKISPAILPMPIPYGLEAITGNTRATLKWKVDRSSAIPIQGYNIYLSDSPKDEGNLYNAVPYPGDTDGDINRESIELVGLTNANRYYASIRTALADGKLTEASQAILFMPIATDTINLSQNYLSDKSGYCFAKGKYTAARDYSNDIYIYGLSGKIGLSSPSLMNSGLRKTLFSPEEENHFSTSLVVKEGGTYTLKTADNAHVKIKLLNFKRPSPEITITIIYTYLPPGIY